MGGSFSHKNLTSCHNKDHLSKGLFLSFSTLCFSQISLFIGKVFSVYRLRKGLVRTD